MIVLLSHNIFCAPFIMYIKPVEFILMYADQKSAKLTYLCLLAINTQAMLKTFHSIPVSFHISIVLITLKYFDDNINMEIIIK